jgi:hypothetical protein
MYGSILLDRKSYCISGALQTGVYTRLLDQSSKPRVSPSMCENLNPDIERERERETETYIYNKIYIYIYLNL